MRKWIPLTCFQQSLGKQNCGSCQESCPEYTPANWISDAILEQLEGRTVNETPMDKGSKLIEYVEKINSVTYYCKENQILKHHRNHGSIKNPLKGLVQSSIFLVFKQSSEGQAHVNVSAGFNSQVQSPFLSCL